MARRQITVSVVPAGATVNAPISNVNVVGQQIYIGASATASPSDLSEYMARLNAFTGTPTTPSPYSWEPASGADISAHLAGIGRSTSTRVMPGGNTETTLVGRPDVNQHVSLGPKRLQSTMTNTHAAAYSGPEECADFIQPGANITATVVPDSASVGRDVKFIDTSACAIKITRVPANKP